MNRVGLKALWPVLLAGLAPWAHATAIGASSSPVPSVLVNENVTVENIMDYNGTIDLAVPGSGELDVTLTDQKGPPFTSLQFALSDDPATVGPLSDPGLLMLDLTAPTAVYVHVLGVTQNGFGLYNLDATFYPTGTSGSEVPLPPAVTLLAGSLLGIWLLGLRPERSLLATARATVIRSVA